MKQFNFKIRNVAIVFACLAVVTTVFASCESADEPNPDTPAFVEFSFANQRGASDIDAKKRTVKAVAECGTNLASLAPAFKLSPEGATATVDGKAQESGKTANNFADAVVYTFTTLDGETAEWTVTITLPDDCPQVKKYITYNKPVKAYFIEYNGGPIDGFVEAYENKEYAHTEDDVLYYTYPNGTEAITLYSSTEWMQGDSEIDNPNAPEAIFWCTYPTMEYPLAVFANSIMCRIYETAYESSIGGALGELWQFAQYPGKYVLPNHTDVTEYYTRSEKVMDIMCDVYQTTGFSASGSPRTWTYWVDPATGFTLKYEGVNNNGNDREGYEVTKLIVGKPDWDGKHLHPLATDKWIK